MAKFCTSCGTQISDVGSYCPSCGALTGSQVEQVSQATAAPTATYEIPEGNTGVATNKTPTTTYIVIAVVGVIAIIIIALIASLFGGGAYTKPIDRMFDGVLQVDGDKYLSAFPEFMTDGMEYDFDDVMEDMLDNLEDEFGKNVKVTYKVTDKEKLDKDDLKYYQKDIKKSYDEKVDVTKGYKLELEVKIKGKDDSNEVETDATVLKIDGKWYLYEGGVL